MAACFAGGSNTTSTTSTSGTSGVDGSTPMAGNVSTMAADAGCAVPEGQFLMEYTYLSGNCPTQVASHPILLSPGNVGVSEVQMNRVSDEVESVVVYKGCSVSVEYRVLTKPDQEVGAPSMFISSVEGDFDVQSETMLSGTATRAEYDPPGTQVCQGEYSVTLTKNETTIGAATN